MKFSKCLPALLALITVCGMVGCDKSGTTSVSDIPDTVAGEETVFEPIPVPEEGWTVQTAASVFCVDGKPITYPFTVNSLGNEYVASDDAISLLETGSYSTFVYRNGEMVFGALYEGLENAEEILSANPKVISASSDYDVVPNVSINGISFGCSKNEALAALGEPENDQSDSLWAYSDCKTGNSCMGIRFEEDKVCTITLIFN